MNTLTIRAAIAALALASGSLAVSGNASSDDTVPCSNVNRLDAAARNNYANENKADALAFFITSNPDPGPDNYGNPSISGIPNCTINSGGIMPYFVGKMIANSSLDSSLVSTLIKAGAPKTSKNSDGKTACDLLAATTDYAPASALTSTEETLSCKGSPKLYDAISGKGSLSASEYKKAIDAAIAIIKDEKTPADALNYADDDGVTPLLLLATQRKWDDDLLEDRLRAIEAMLARKETKCAHSGATKPEPKTALGNPFFALLFSARERYLWDREPINAATVPYALAERCKSVFPFTEAAGGGSEDEPEGGGFGAASEPVEVISTTTVKGSRFSAQSLQNFGFEPDVFHGNYWTPFALKNGMTLRGVFECTDENGCEAIGFPSPADRTDFEQQGGHVFGVRCGAKSMFEDDALEHEESRDFEHSPDLETISRHECIAISSGSFVLTISIER